MTEDQEDLVYRACAAVGSVREVLQAQLAASIGDQGAAEWVHGEVRDAVRDRDGDHLDAAILAGWLFDCWTVESVRSLVGAYPGDWHRSHEEILRVVSSQPSGDFLPVVLRALEVQPGYLPEDDVTPFRILALHALARLPLPVVVHGHLVSYASQEGPLGAEARAMLEKSTR